MGLQGLLVRQGMAFQAGGTAYAESRKHEATEVQIVWYITGVMV